MEEPGIEEPGIEEPGANCGVDAEGNMLVGTATINGPDTINAGSIRTFSLSLTNSDLTPPYTYEWRQTEGTEGTISQNSESVRFSTPLTIETIELTTIITDSEGLCLSAQKSVSIVATQLDIYEPNSVSRNEELNFFIYKNNLPPTARNKDVTLQLVQQSGPPVPITYVNSDFQLSIQFSVPNDLSPLEFVLYGIYEGRAFSRQPVVVSPTNRTPVARINRSAYPIIVSGFKHQPITLDGATSIDPDGDTLKYQWTQIAGEPVDIPAPTSPQLTLTMPGFMDSLEFRLVVEDEYGAEDDLTVTVNVRNNPPVADAGNDFVAPAGIPIFMNGNASSDADNDILTYVWTQLTGPTLQLTNPSSSSPSFIAEQPGEGYLFKVEVYDGDTYSDNDSFVAVSIKPNTEDLDTDGDTIPDRYDADEDGDGLLELFTDELFNIIKVRRLNLLGCPTQGCNGYELTADLDFDTNQDGQIGEGDDWTTLQLRWRGEARYTAFNFDGNLHSLNNLPGNLTYSFIDAPYLSEPIEAKAYFVRNLQLNSIDIDWQHNGLFSQVQLSNGRSLTLENISVTGNRSGGTNVSGMIGILDIRRSSQVDFITCSYQGNLLNLASTAGGLIGEATVYSSTLNIVDSHSTTSINGAENLGGLIGYVSASTGIVNIVRSHSSGEITKTGPIESWALSGGLVGHFNSNWDDQPYAELNIIDSYSTMNLLTNSSQVGGLLGRYYTSSPNTHLTIEGSYFAGHVMGNGYIGGLVGFSDSGTTTIKNSWTGGLIEGSADGFANLPSIGSFAGGIRPSGNRVRVSNSYSVSQVQYGTETGALIGVVYTDDAPTDLSVLMESSYWSQDVTGQALAVGRDETFIVDDRTTMVEYVSELACPISSDDFTCSTSVLFENWGSELNEQSLPAWDFGNSDQLPGLRLGDDIHRPVLDPVTGLYTVPL
ncbi:hypothetical protein Kalk_10480 [Ketobacter alkanivorans]|uniref:GLUG domain-containing protein n=1 Tax=Ketobacter alkanivorans TaxID=1917421 RepID=A0A2K9LKE8_9GAMM|nr:hypothetical protein Kalk_10480 [Ketobacter alkanivorans]